MNSVVLIGRLTREPEIRYTESQLAVARFTLAVERLKLNSRDETNTTDFINIVVFGKQAENVEKYLAKGSLVAIQGRIQTGSYINKEGNKVYTTDIVADRIKFLNKQNKKDEYQSYSFNNKTLEGFDILDEESIPF